MELTFCYAPEVDSTNNRLKEAAETGATEGTVFSAGRQTAGRGRSGHTWESPRNESVSTSILLYPTELSVEETALLTPLAALAVADAIEELYRIPAQIKWVNDVLLFQKKVSGILAEQIWMRDGRRAVIIGIGINVHQQKFPGEIAGMATSIDLALSMRENDGRKVKPAWDGQEDHFPKSGEICRAKKGSRKELTEQLWKDFIRYYEAFGKEKNLSFVRDAYNARLINRGKRCRVLDPKGAYDGTAGDIDDHGRLWIRLDDGTMRAVDFGEVSVRGIYGYV